MECDVGVCVGRCGEGEWEGWRVDGRLEQNPCRVY